MEGKVLGIPVVLVAASAIFGLLPQQSQRPASGPPRTPAPSDTSLQAAAQASSTRTPNEEGGPWNALDAFTAGKRPADNSRCATWSCASALGSNVKFLIATVPDPKTTNLALFFDRSLESLVWAAQDSGFEFEHYWLPWKKAVDKDLPLLRDRQAQEAEAKRVAGEPGLIVFRPDKNGPTLLIFVVGETPTSGINSRAFAKAAGYIGEISLRVSAPADYIPVGVAGPTFTGSLAPLARDLPALLKGPPKIHLHFISGSATGGKAIQDFKSSISGFTDQVRFDAVVENDVDAIQGFTEYLKCQGQAPTGIAVLAEGGTQYGSGLSFQTGNDQKNLVIRYPRQIARLRNSSDEQDPRADPNSTPRSDGVKFTLKDSPDDDSSSAAKDDIPQFSKQQGPASQQSTLITISSMLRRERSSYVGIIATDVLDSLFLSRFVRETSPDARVFLLDSDLLFTREIATSPVLGILAITTYPLFPRNQHWTQAKLAGGVGRRLPFSSADAEGVYNASCALLGDSTPSGAARGCLMEYSSPENPAINRPPLWLTVLGRDGYWPVALLNERHKKSSTLLWSDTTGAKLDFHPERPSADWYIVFWIAVLFSVLHCMYILHLLRAEARRPNAGSMRHRRQNPLDWLHSLDSVFPVYKEVRYRYEARQPFLIAASLALTCIVGMLTLTLIPYWNMPLVDRWPCLVHTPVGALCCLLLAGTTFKLWPSICDESGRFDRRAVSPLLMLAVTIVSLGVFLYLILVGKFQSGFFFAYRSQMLTSGVSPLTPILILALAYFHFAWVQLRREDMITGRANLKAISDMPANPFLKKIHKQACEIDGAVGHILPPPPVVAAAGRNGCACALLSAVGNTEVCRTAALRPAVFGPDRNLLLDSRSGLDPVFRDLARIQEASGRHRNQPGPQWILASAKRDFLAAAGLAYPRAAVLHYNAMPGHAGGAAELRCRRA